MNGGKKRKFYEATKNFKNPGNPSNSKKKRPITIVAIKGTTNVSACFKKIKAIRS